ncbi:hypothetical protein HZB03_02845 [Candidatus Woesearchaeota archaeon]|nr:hypothetical protein [Candidatus Woesearchaeota archaeon]
MHLQFKRRFKGKKAQFYIFTALILIAYTATLLRPQQLMMPPSKVFAEVNGNFVREGKEVINNALFEQANVSREYTLFVDRFVAYALLRGMDLEVFSILVDGGQIHLSNRLKKDASLLGRSEIIGVGGELTIPKNVTVITINAPTDVQHPNIYAFNITAERTQVMSFIRAQVREDNKAFVNT